MSSDPVKAIPPLAPSHPPTVLMAGQRRWAEVIGQELALLWEQTHGETLGERTKAFDKPSHSKLNQLSSLESVQSHREP